VVRNRTPGGVRGRGKKFPQPTRLALLASADHVDDLNAGLIRYLFSAEVIP